MHEVGIINRIIDEAKKFGRVKNVEVEVGELCDVEAEEVEELLREMTPWGVKVIVKKGVVECRCGYRGSAEVIERGHGFCVFACPKCKGKPRVVEGGKIKLVGVE